MKYLGYTNHSKKYSTVESFKWLAIKSQFRKSEITVVA